MLPKSVYVVTIATAMSGLAEKQTDIQESSRLDLLDHRNQGGGPIAVSGPFFIFPFTTYTITSQYDHKIFRIHILGQE